MRLTERRKVKRGEDWLAERDPQMRELIDRFGRCQLRPWHNDPFSTLISSIISQQLSVKAASTICERFYQLVGTPPLSPRRILKVAHSDLRACGLSNAKATYCLGIADAAATGKVCFAQLRKMEPAKIMDKLVQLKGVGQWTAEMFLIFGLGYQDIWSYGDLGLKKGVMLIKELQQTPSEKEFVEVGECWRPYRSIASWYLWRLVENR